MAQIYKRRLIREKVLQLLYAFEMNSDNKNILITEMLSDVKDEADRNFAISLINKISEHQNDLDELIKHKVDNWDLNRIALIDRILLRMGICEILYFNDIPPKVSINESIEIAKSFSTSSSGKFINGILDAILIDLKSDNKLKKKGRGLIDESFTHLTSEE
jgi:N utilization substance protein B